MILCATLGTTRVVRQIYLDEAGTSANDQHAVVAGPVVHADEKLWVLQDRLEAIAAEFIPEQDRHGFVFHMTDLWNNGKYFRDKSVWSWERKKPIIDALVDIPRQLELPVVMHFVERRDIVERFPEFSVGQIDLASTAIAFSACEMIAEQLMRDAFPNEIAQIIAEDNQHARNIIRGSHNIYRDPREWIAASDLNAAHLPFRHIQNGVLFAAKSESPALQVADMCAFFIRAHLRHQNHSEEFYQRIKPWLAVLPRGEEEIVSTLRPAWPYGPLGATYGE